MLRACLEPIQKHKGPAASNEAHDHEGSPESPQATITGTAATRTIQKKARHPKNAALELRHASE
jgi:hypothetical protein